MLPFLYYHGLRLFGLPTLARRMRPASLILGYHNVVPPTPIQTTSGGDPGAHLPLDVFTAQVTWLASRYRVVPLSEIVDRLAAGRPLGGLAAITFDDGYAGALSHGWPMLRNLGLPATAFLIAHQAEASAFWWDHPAVARVESGDREHWLTTQRGDATAILATLSPHPPRPVPPPSYLAARWETITAASASGLTLGAHSLTHRNLPLLNDAELER